MDIYRSRFVQYPTSGINCLAFSHTSAEDFIKGEKTPALRLALGRANGDIELWNPQAGVWTQEVIFKGGKDRSVEGLVWIQDPVDIDREGNPVPGALRLFSIGYSSTVTEWNLVTALPLRQWSGNHSEVWCIAAQPRHQRSKKPTAEWPGQNLVAGCADGSLVALSTEDNDLQFKRFLARPTSKRARVLSIAFQNRSTVVAGFADSTIRVYNLKEGRLIRNITLGAGPVGGPKDILVWTVKCLTNGDIVSGDSIGEVRIFDKKFYSQIQRLGSHDSDVLDLAVSCKQSVFFSAGLDRRTAKYVKTSAHARYSKASHATYHEHDVKAMTTYESSSLDVIASGGIDTNLVIIPLRRHGEQYQFTISGLPRQPPMDSTNTGRVVCWWEREVSVWKVFAIRGVFPAKKHELRARIALKGEENITSVAISPSGDDLVVATVAEIKVFRLTKDKTRQRTVYTVEKRPSLGTSGAKLVKFSPDGTWVAVVSYKNEVQLFKISVDGGSADAVRLQRRTRTRKESALGAYPSTITHIIFSPDSRMLITSDLSGILDSWIYNPLSSPPQTNGKPNPSSDSDEEGSDSDDEEGSDSDDEGGSQDWSPNPATKNAPQLNSAPITLTFRPQKSSEKPRYYVFVMTAKHRLYELDMTSGLFTDWSKRNSVTALPEAFKRIKDRAKGSFWGEEGWLWLYGATWVFGLNVDVDHMEQTGFDKAGDESVEEQTKGKKRKRDSSGGGGDGIREKDVSGLVHLPEIASGSADATVDTEDINMEMDPERREKQVQAVEDDDDDSDTDSDGFVENLRGGNSSIQKGAKSKANWFLTHKYRPIVGIVPVYPATDRAPAEVMLVERPIWSLDLPARYDSSYGR